MKPVQSLIQKAHDKGLLRYAPEKIEWAANPHPYQFDLRRSSMSGVEFGYSLARDEITFAVQTIDGIEIEPDRFLDELKRAVGVDDQPCQHYAATRAIVDEEPEVTAHNDEPERTYLVTQITEVRATDEYQAIGRVNTLHGSCELLSQEAEPKLEKFRVGAVHEVWAEDEKHAVEQFYDIVNNDNGEEIVNLMKEVSS